MSISEIEEMASSAKKKNFKLDVTGLLIRKTKGFIQYLEGDKTTITELYEEILRDKRHHSLVVIDKGYTTHRKFAKWSMLLKYVTKEEIQAIEAIRNKSAKYRKKENWGNLEAVLEVIKNYQN